MKKINIILALFLAFTISSCLQLEPPLELNYTTLQLRQFQKREFKAHDQLELTKIVIAALQDLGFVIKNISSELGIINAEMQISESGALHQYIQSWIFHENTIASIKHWDATIHIYKSEGKYVVKANFITKALNKAGNIIKAEPMQDRKFYQDFFSIIEQALLAKLNKS